MDNRKEYYFSINSVFLSIFLTFVFVTMTPLLIAGIFYINGGLWLLPLLIVYLFMFYISIPTYRSMFFKLSSKPAIILTDNEFIDNLSKQKFKWNDIKRISYYESSSKFSMTNIYLELYDPNAKNVLTGNLLDKFLRKFDNSFYKGSYRFNPNSIKGQNKVLLDDILFYKNKNQ